MDYIDNLNIFLSSLKLVIPINNKLTFLPSFKGKYVVEKLGILSFDRENEMKVFKIKSKAFLEDEELIDNIMNEMLKICEEITVEQDVITFYLH